MTHCLDTWAVIALLRKEPGGPRVAEILAQRPVMSWINVGEVYYVVSRLLNQREARSAITDLRSQARLDVATDGRVLQAAEIKANHRLSYADAFAVATAVAHGATLLTGDPEIIDAHLDCDVEDLR